MSEEAQQQKHAHHPHRHHESSSGSHTSGSSQKKEKSSKRLSTRLSKTVADLATTLSSKRSSSEDLHQQQQLESRSFTSDVPTTAATTTTSEDGSGALIHTFPAVPIEPWHDTRPSPPTQEELRRRSNSNTMNSTALLFTQQKETNQQLRELRAEMRLMSMQLETLNNQQLAQQRLAWHSQPKPAAAEENEETFCEQWCDLW